MATIVMESAKVIEAAQAVIAHIEAKRIERDEAAIDRRMKDRAFSLRRWFYWMTREEAIDWLDKNNFFGWRSMYAWGDKEHAQKLLTLARHGDPVTLNEEDTRVLF